MKAVMYHYVREGLAELPYFRYLHVENFRKQLDHFSANFHILGRNEFLAAVDNGQPAADSIVLTFDDGLSDHFDYVLPELEKRGLWGIFYVATGPLSSGTALSVHIVHRLLGTYGGAAMLEAVMRIVKPEMLTHAHVEEFKTLTYPDQSDDHEATTLFKRMLNYFISVEWQRPVIDRLVADMPLGSLDDIYLSREQIKEMHAKGHLIGSHSVSHPLFSKLDVDIQRSEIEDSFSYLESFIGDQPTRTFCYPYGGFHSFTNETEEILADNGCKFSFNVEYRDIAPIDLTGRPHALPRYDCNLFPHGRAN